MGNSFVRPRDGSGIANDFAAALTLDGQGYRFVRVLNFEVRADQDVSFAKLIA